MHKSTLNTCTFTLYRRPIVAYQFNMKRSLAFSSGSNGGVPCQGISSNALPLDEGANCFPCFFRRDRSATSQFRFQYPPAEIHESNFIRERERCIQHYLARVSRGRLVDKDGLLVDEY